MPTTTWIVAADSSRARVMQVADRERLVEIENLLNPDGRLQDRELTTDANPRLHGPGGLSKNISWFNARELERYFAKGSGRAP